MNFTNAASSVVVVVNSSSILVTDTEEMLLAIERGRRDYETRHDREEK